MTNDLGKLIRELSEIYDTESKDTFVSVYINKIADPKYLNRRENTCKSLLKGDEQKNFEDTIEEIKEHIKRTPENNLAVFASKKHNFFRSVILPMEIHNSLVVDSSPYIRPLARIQDEYESFTLVLINTNYAKMFSVLSDQIVTPVLYTPG